MMRKWLAAERRRIQAWAREQWQREERDTLAATAPRWVRALCRTPRWAVQAALVVSAVGATAGALHAPEFVDGTTAYRVATGIGLGMLWVAIAGLCWITSWLSRNPAKEEDA